ncbi:polysaccharide deacetylase family protein [Marimonas arenosa]|uniref:Chitooligosaccharide deacetylase n=1 Tax=Marimonas arenosa TaxID=1795305 RepID=A0AAE3WBL9_9RHOB|nr:polysaccharide deacetylase family protein [Marimonas arenosa]MDQ2089654.1 polysaccharide deacetylase family protein [Marimonas arenosa]
MIVLYAVALFGSLLAAWYLIPFALRRLSSGKLRRYCREQGIVVLSYDDGPSEQLLPQLLELLSEHKVQATFFLLGRNAEVNREAVRLLREGGHEVGSHTYDHSNAWKTWPWHSAADLAKGLKSLQSNGATTEIFRPPYGKATLLTFFDCYLRKLRLGWWTIDSQDVWKRRPVSDVLNELKTDGGGVILMHDLDRDEVQADGMSHSDYVLGLTREVIDFASRSGLKMQRMGDIYAKALD